MSQRPGGIDNEGTPLDDIFYLDTATECQQDFMKIFDAENGTIVKFYFSDVCLEFVRDTELSFIDQVAHELSNYLKVWALSKKTIKTMVFSFLRNPYFLKQFEEYRVGEF